MGKATDPVNDDLLAPARSQADWDAQGWAAEAELVDIAPRLETTISIRFDPESAALLRRAARRRGQTQSQFIRSATLQAARHVTDRAAGPSPTQEQGAVTVSKNRFTESPVPTTGLTVSGGLVYANITVQFRDSPEEMVATTVSLGADT